MALSGALSEAQRYKLYLQAGFNAGEAQVMTALSYLECGNCDMSRVNATGDVGLSQINRLHWGSTDPTRSRFGDLTDPAVSARAARSVFLGAGGDANPSDGYGQWCTYPGGCGGASTTTWPAFNSLLQRVVAAIGDAPAGGNTIVQTPEPGAGFNPDPGSIGTIPMPGGPTPPGTPRTPAEANPCAAAGQTVLLTLPGGAELRAGPIGEAMCNIGRAVAFFEHPGTWWAVLLFGGGLVAILFGAFLYFNGPEQVGKVAKVAAVAAVA